MDCCEVGRENKAESSARYSREAERIDGKSNDTSCSLVSDVFYFFEIPPASEAGCWTPSSNGSVESPRWRAEEQPPPGRRRCLPVFT